MSCDLVIDLLALRTTIVGTMRKNRTDILKKMQPCEARQELSLILGFDRHLTPTCYVPKKVKAVILLSSIYHDNGVVAANANKPEIIMHYNATKYGVDTLDHL